MTGAPTPQSLEEQAVHAFVPPPPRKIRVYIAGPYTSPDPVINTRKAMLVWHELRRRGFSPFCPHTNLLLHMIEPLGNGQDWLEWDKEWLAVCDVLYRYEVDHGGQPRCLAPGTCVPWHTPDPSPGADDEVADCLKWAIPVCYTIEELLEFKDEWPRSAKKS